MRALGATARPEFDVTATRRRVAFRVDGRERWVIDADRFGAGARLSFEQGDERISLMLSRARYPGTDFPADMKCEIVRGAGGWTIAIDMSIGLRAETAFEPWLLGKRPLASMVSLDHSVCSFADKSSMRVRGMATAAFFADWTMRIEGNAIASYDGLGNALASDALHLQLLSSESGSVLASRNADRTLIEIDRGRHDWHPIIPESMTAGWRIRSQENAFDQISIEAAESRDGARVQALVAEGLGDDVMSVHPCSGFSGRNGDDCGIPLSRARYAAAYHGASIQSAIIAHYGESVWLHANECSLKIGDDSSSPRFELVTTNGEVESVRLQPALLSTYIGVEGAITEPGPVRAGSRAYFTRDGDTAPRDATEIRINNLRPDDPPIWALASTPTIPVIRHEDLVHISFEFVNMKVQNGGIGGRGTRHVSSTGGTSYLVAHFPPQNFAEQAFFETDADFQPEDSNTDKPPDPDKNTGNEDPLSPTPHIPVLSRISGPSRLAFKLPAGVSTIALEIETLLKALTTYEPSLAATALPPQYVGEIFQIIDIDALKVVPAWSSYGKRAAIENMSNTRMSPLVTTAGDAAFAQQPKGTARTRAASKGFVTLKQGATPRTTSRVGTAALRSGLTQYSAQSVDAAKAAATKLTKSKEDIESIYQIDASDLELATSAALDKVKAAVKIRPKLARPTNTQTAIESPYRLIISPNEYGKWTHALTPVVHLQPVSEQPHTELWHTRLGVEGQDGVNEFDGKDEVDELSSDLRTIRAIWMESPKPFSTEYMTDVKHYKVGVSSIENPFRMSLDEYDRHNIVHLSANWHISTPATGGKKTRGWYEPLPVKVERLMLTSLGSWMNVRGAWSPPVPLSVEEWRHRATMGRDHYVRVVYKGYLFPFGHRASLIKITERKFHKSAWGNIAYLRQRMYIVVRQPEKTFRVSNLVSKPTGVVANDGSNSELIDLKMPFHKVKITTLITPNLDEPTMNEIANQGQSGFWPMVGGKPFLFQMTADDLDNQKTEMAMPLVFVENNIAHDATKMKSVRDAYEVFPARPTVATTGGKVAFAESDKLGDTSYETKSLTWGAAIPNQVVTLPPDQPRFYPVVQKANLSIPSIKYLAQSDGGSDFKYNSTFLKVGFLGANAGKVLMDLATSASPVPLDFSTRGEKSGGFVKPNMNITGLSRAMGPVAGDVSKIENGQFDPQSFFAGMGAKLFGVLNLWDILEALGLLDKAPQFVTEALTSLQTIQNDLNALKSFLEDPVVGSFGSTVKTDITNVLNALANILTDPGTFSTALTTFSNDVKALKATLPSVSFDPGIKRSIERMLVDFSRELEDAAKIVQYATRLVEALEIPKEIKITLEWKPKLASWPTVDPIFVVDPNVGGLALGVEMIAQTNFKSEPKFEIYCRLTDFKIDLIAPLASFIVLHFKQIGFFANSAMKSDIVCDLEKVEFVGVLSFIETLKELIPLDGFSDPPAIDVSPSGIEASFSIALPNIAFGVFAMSNMSLGAGFKLPFIGEPLSFSFNFCTRENPFLLTISCIGGGGFFGITLNPEGIHILEASFEVGVQLAVDFGVASGSVYAMAGIYFKMEGENCSLTGYFRLGGEVSVLGIISVSIELYLSLTYEFSTGKCVGRATLTISIEVFFFEITVEISCEKKFSGSNGDPTFVQMMAPYMAPSLSAPTTTVEVNPWKEYCNAYSWS